MLGVSMHGSVPIGGAPYVGTPLSTGGAGGGGAVSGRAVIRLHGSAEVTPPVPAAVLASRRGYRYDLALALPTPVMVDGRPTGTAYTTARAVSKPAGWDRVLVGGVDITTVNELTTPTPPYRLMEPGGYGTSTLTVPGVNGVLEPVGKGTAYPWARAGAEVLYQRTDDAGAVIATDYRGVVLDVTPSSTLTLTVGGAVMGRAEGIEWPPPVFRRVADVEVWVTGLLRQCRVPLRRTDAGTGIRLVKAGGMAGVSYLQYLLAQAQRRNGDQYTLMPVTWGGRKFELRLKDRTTVDYTVYVDGARVVADLVDEQPTNSWYGTGITPPDKRGAVFLERGTRVPGGVQGVPPPFPMAAGATMSQGLTDAGTTSGDGVTVLNRALSLFGFLDDDSKWSGTFDADTTEAVEDFQEHAGFDVTGAVTKKTWNALFDLEVTGPNVEGARIFPILEDRRLRRYLYSATGHVIGRNPKHDPTLLRRDRRVDFGPNWTYRRMKRWFRAQNARTKATGNLVGTIALDKVGVISGTHNPGDLAPDASRVVSLRDVRPGKNVRLPQFGGAVLHVAGVEVDPASGRATLQVDAQARDLLDIVKLSERDAAARNDPRRTARNERRRSVMQHDGSTPWERWAGMLPWDVDVPANAWVVFWVFAGQGGRVGKFLLDTSPAAETCGVVFSRKVSAARLENRIPDPWTLNAKKESVWETDARLKPWLEDREALLVWGNDDNPGGYGLRRKKNDAGELTGAPLTGRVVDEDGFEYLSAAGPVLWVAVRSRTATKVQAGRVMWREAEDLG